MIVSQCWFIPGRKCAILVGDGESGEAVSVWAVSLWEISVPFNFISNLKLRNESPKTKQNKKTKIQTNKNHGEGFGEPPAQRSSPCCRLSQGSETQRGARLL